MRSFFMFSVLALTASIVAQDVDSNDVPSQCQDACAPVVSLTSSCDRTSNNDTAERKCVCNDSRASKSVPNCAACLDKYSKDGKDNDANDLVRKCSFASTTYGASASATSNSAGMTSPSMDSGSGTMSATMSETASATDSATGSNAASSTPNVAGKSTELATGLFGTALLSIMAFVGL